MNPKLISVVLVLSVIAGLACSSPGKIAQSEGMSVNEEAPHHVADDVSMAGVALEGTDTDAIREPWAPGYLEDGRRREWKELVIVIDESSRDHDRFEPIGVWGVIDTEGRAVHPKPKEQNLLKRDFWMPSPHPNQAAGRNMFHMSYPFQAAGDGQIFVIVRVDYSDYGLVTLLGEWRIEPIYDELKFLTSEKIDAAGGPFVKAKTRSGQVGLMNMKGEWVITPEYSDLEIIADASYVRVEMGSGDMGIKNLKNEWVIPSKAHWDVPPDFLKIRRVFASPVINAAGGPFAEVYYGADGAYKFGLMNFEKEFLFEIKESKRIAEEEDNFFWDDNDWRFEVYDSPEFLALGGPFVVVKACEILEVVEGNGYVWLCEQQEGDKYFSFGSSDPCYIYAMRTGERLHAKDLTKCESINTGIFPVREAKSGLEGYMNLKGEMVIPAVFVTAMPFENGRARVRLSLDYAKSLCKKSGTKAHAKSQNSHNENIMASCASGFRNWEKATKYCRRGDVISHLWSRVLGRCACDWSSLKEQSLLYMCDEKGTYVNYGWAYIDEQGQLLTRFDYERLGVFSGGIALVRRDERYGYIDETGYEIIPPFFSTAGSFDEGAARVWWYAGDEDEDEDDDEDGIGGYYCGLEYELDMKALRESTQRHRKSFSKLDYANGWQAISQTWESEADGCLSLNAYCLVREGESVTGVVMACESLSNGVEQKPQASKQATLGRHWVRDEDLAGYGLMENGQWLTPYRLNFMPDMTDRGLSRMRIYKDRKSESTYYEIIWINAAGRIIWPLAWNEPCQDTEGHVKWPEGACKGE
ncbi:MAG: WG repeat-containing protein [Proteobacteria bacterium]|nr:WG repeat-containing protein [Pseudomonadota bacterium]